jgi:hypothetical protein
MWVSPVSRRSFKRQRNFGIPAATAKDSLTDPDSRIMKRAGGSFGGCFSAQTVVDEAAHIAVAAEVVHTSSYVRKGPKVPDPLEASHCR